jgi:hypothetical protein
MARAYSLDLRERVVAAVAAGYALKENSGRVSVARPIAERHGSLVRARWRKGDRGRMPIVEPAPEALMKAPV